MESFVLLSKFPQDSLLDVSILSLCRTLLLENNVRLKLQQVTLARETLHIVIFVATSAWYKLKHVSLIFRN